MVPNDAKLQSVLDTYKDRFPTELPLGRLLSAMSIILFL